ncbi:hypothetical protein [Serratia surfactantfaciens]|uniref:hypothetical protein n=1 Tax=Serratia surfactantfaciens TaxID=2741499 RepID=UPI0018E49F24|nr:hypothetical protein [Serratia surfactantfaciens]MBI6153433.1 hypothetical protein [Serratia surfactantfaciens]
MTPDAWLGAASNLSAIALGIHAIFMAKINAAGGEKVSWVKLFRRKRGFILPGAHCCYAHLDNNFAAANSYFIF